MEREILLTAGHCTFGTVGQTVVTSDPDAAREAADVPGSVPVAADPAVGYTEADLAACPDRYAGTALTHPQYSDVTDLDNWNDVGVVDLTEDVPDLPLADVAPTNHLEQFAQPRLNTTLFTVGTMPTGPVAPAAGPVRVRAGGSGT